MTSADDEIRILKEGWRLLGRDAQAELLARGWAVVDLNVADDAPLEFFWPPTAPLGYGDRVEKRGPDIQMRPEIYPARSTPWIRPTRIFRTGSAWRINFGEAIAQAPDASVEHADDESLLDDLPRIEWWPLPVDEARSLQNERVLHTTYAEAYDQHSLGYFIRTEPYESRLQEVYDRIQSKKPILMGDPDAWRWTGDLHARVRIIDGEMWASAVRTARAGGEDWATSSAKNDPDE